MKFKHLFLAIALLSSCNILNAQLANGSIAPNVTFSDLNGNTHELYDILDQGKSVIFDAMATWCGPCWNYHNSQVLKTIYNTYGPAGTNEVEVFMVEASPSTTQPCLYGPNNCNGGTIGDWVTGTPYPIVHIQSDNAPSFSSDYNIPGYPTLYKVCPNKKIYRITTGGTQIWIDWITSCSLEGEGTVSNSICFNDGLGGVDLDVTGGLGNKTYNWSNGSTSQDLNGVDPGSYSCTITEAQGHSIEVGPFVVDGSSSPLDVNLLQVVDVPCFGDNTGMAFTSTSGGAAGYSYNWNNGTQGPDLMNVFAGNYTLSVTDNLGCEETLPVEIFSPTPLLVDGISNSENCGQMDGSISLFGAGGTGSYEYDIGNGPQGSNVFLNLSAGPYEATITDENNCTEQVQVVVAAVAGPTAEAGPDAAVDCANPSVQLDGTGSTTGNDISINWTTTDGNIDSGANTLNPTVDRSGTYTISITNSITGCVSTDVVTVTGDNAVPMADAGSDGIIDCNSATYLLDGNGSSSGSQYSYSWKDDDGNVVGSNVTYETSLAGEYELIVTNSDNGCTATSLATVVENLASPDADAGLNQTIDCNNSTVTLIGTTNVSNPSFEWKNSSGTIVSTDFSIVVNDADDYTLSVLNTDNGCSSEDVVTVNVDTNLPTSDAGPNATIDCNNSQVQLGGNSSSGSMISYSWLDANDMVVGTNVNLDVTEAGSYQLIVTDGGNGCTSSSSANVDLDTEIPLTDAGQDLTITCDNSSVTLDGNGSASGSQYNYEWLNSTGTVVGQNIEYEAVQTDVYTLRITNSNNGCIATDQAEVFENTELPLSNAGSDGQIDCSSSSIELNGSGSSAGSQFSYIWRNGAGNIIGNDLIVEVSNPGIYSLEVINEDNGCSLVDMATVTASTDFPLVVTDVDGELNCVQNTVELSGNGSSNGSDYSYSWLDESGTEISNEVDVDVNESGTYTLVILNTSNGCEASEDVIVTSNTELPESIIENPNSFDCNTSSILLDGTNSLGVDLNYSWRNSANQEVGINSTLMIQNPGTYSLIVSDGGNGCLSEATFVQVMELPSVAISLVSSADVLCFGESNGNAIVESSGGVGGYEYEWPGGVSGASQTNLSAGTYQVTSTDQNGCSDEIEVTIDEPSLLTISITSSNESGDNLNDGSASAIVSGGTGVVSYEWSNNATGSNIDHLAPGVYTVTVSDENGCTVEEIVNISSFDCLLEVNSSFTNVSCNGGNDGSIILNIPQGTANTFSWNNGLSSSNLNGLAPGVYSYTVTDINNCDVLGQVEIFEPPLLTSEIVNVQNIACGSGQSGMATVNVAGGTGVYTFLWSNGETTATAMQLTAGNHSVMVTDENGCSVNNIVSIEADDMIAPHAVTQNIEVAINENGLAFISVADINAGSSDNCGIANLSLSQNTFDCSELGEQVIELTVEDLSGNTNTATAVVNVIDNIAPEITCQPNLFTNSCSAIQYDIPVATDNCSVNIELVEGLPSGSIFPVGSHVITYRAVDPSGNMNTCTFEITVINDLVSSTMSNDVLCYDEATGSASVMVTGGTPGYQYLWDNGQQTATATGLLVGNYSVTVTDNTGCTSEQSVFVDEPEELIFEVNELINDTNGQGIGSISVTASGGVPGYGYTWTKDGVFYSNDEDLIGLTAGNYGLEVIDANGCIEQKFGLNIDNMVPTQNIELLNQIRMMPNPTAGLLLINFEFDEQQTVSMELIDLHGSVLRSFDYGKTDLDYKTVDLSEFPDGVYLIQFQVNQEFVSKRIVVQH